MPDTLLTEVGTAPSVGDGRSPTIMDVARAYQLFLGRSVENATVAGHHIATNPGIWDLVERFHGSEETRRRRMHAVLAELQDHHRLAAEPRTISGSDLDRLVEELLSDWDRRGLGGTDHWLRRNEARYDDRSEKWNLEKSLDRGDLEARQILEHLARNGFHLSSEQDVLLFGDEAFRLSRALDQAARSYAGVEISSRGVHRASRASELFPSAKSRSFDLRAFLEKPLDCDLFCSVMALHYAPPPVALEWLRRFLGCVRPGGVAFFQIASHLHGYRFDPDAYLAGEDRNPDGEIHAVPQREILALLARENFTVLEIIPDPSVDGLGASYTYIAGRRTA